MDGMQEKLEAILSDPASMNQIMELAKGLGLNPPPLQVPMTPESPAASGAVSGDSGSSSAQSVVNPFAALMTAMGNQGGDDKHTLLLKALRPYLRPERQERLDRAVQTAKMVRVAKQAMRQMTP